mgnify:CR=1 FL=1|jgi:peptidoglycan hydrolase-like protein with peptidoglycan-binding domain
MEQSLDPRRARHRQAVTGALLALALAAAGPGGEVGAPSAHAGTEEIAATRAQVRQVQEQLNALGYDAGPVDGQYGRTTRQAILQFERDHDLPTVGLPDAQVRARIEAALRRERADPGAQDGGADDAHDGEPGASAEDATKGHPDGDSRTDRAHDLAGTRWRLHHPQGQTIVLTFERGGAIQAPAGTWQWERRDNGRIVIRYDSGSRLTSRLIGQLHTPRQMRGWGRDTFGERWQWSAERLDARNGS